MAYENALTLPEKSEFSQKKTWIQEISWKLLSLGIGLQLKSKSRFGFTSVNCNLSCTKPKGNWCSENRTVPPTHSKQPGQPNPLHAVARNWESNPFHWHEGQEALPLHLSIWLSFGAGKKCKYRTSWISKAKDTELKIFHWSSTLDHLAVFPENC